MKIDFIFLQTYLEYSESNIQSIESRGRDRVGFTKKSISCQKAWFFLRKKKGIGSFLWVKYHFI